MPQHAIGYIIRQRRLELGMTQEDLAERVSTAGELLKQAEISRIENGHVKLPRPARLQRIADALGLSFGDLLLRASGIDEHGRVLVEQSPDEDLETGASEDVWDTPRLHFRLLEGVKQAVIVTDLDGTIRYWNAYAEFLYGRKAADVVGRTMFDVVVADGREWQERAEAITRQLAAGQRWSGTFQTRRSDGTNLRVQVLLAPVLDQNGSIVAVFGSSFEVTEVRARQVVG